MTEGAHASSGTVGKVLVTGANGFIGSRLVRTLWECGYDVLATSRSAEPAGYLETGLASMRIEYLSLDLADRTSLYMSLSERNIRAIIHAAWDWQKDPVRNTASNISGMINLLDVALSVEAERFIYIGSDAVYGGEQECIREGDAFVVKAKTRIYPLLKALTSLLVTQQRSSANCRFLIAVPCGPVYGPGMSPGRENRWPIYYMLANALQERPTVLVGGQESKAGYTHVADVCAGVRLLLEKAAPARDIYHFGPGREWNMEEIAEIVRKLVPGCRIEVGPGLAEPGWSPGVPRPGFLDITAARTELGFAPGYDLIQGLKELKEYMESL